MIDWTRKETTRTIAGVEYKRHRYVADRGGFEIVPGRFTREHRHVGNVVMQNGEAIFHTDTLAEAKAEVERRHDR